MNNADNINAILKRKIENQIISHSLATQILFKLLMVCSHLREVGQRQTTFLNTIKKPVGVGWTVLCDIPLDFVKIAFGFWPLQQTGHPDFILSFVARKAAPGLAS
jgi:hypothetical protein